MKSQLEGIRNRLLNCLHSGDQDDCWKIAAEYIRSEGNCRIEELVAANSDILSIQSLPIEIVAAEIDSRRSKGETVLRDEYYRRFPQLAKLLPTTLFETNDSQVDSTNVNPFSSMVTEPQEGCEHPGRASDPSVLDLASGQVFGSYRVLGKIGQGGMGAVYKAVHSKLNKEVALKVLPANLTRDIRRIKRFEREMMSLGALEHPNIVRATDAGEVAGIHYLAMEYVEGVDLQRHVRENGPCSLADACQYVCDAAHGLQAAHEFGLVHRDIKPANLLLSTSGMVKVSDFGLARLQPVAATEKDDDLLTREGDWLGTPDYISPEQWERSAMVDHRADLYALGCSFFFLLTGRPPFSGDGFVSLSQKMKAHLLGQPPSVEQILGKPLPAAVDNLIGDLLQKSITERVQNAKTLIERLDGISETQRMVTQKRLSARMRKWSRPLTASILLLCCVSMGIWWRMADYSPIQSKGGLPASQSQPELSPIALPTIRIELFEKKDDEILQVGTLGEGIDSAKFGEWLQMQFTFPQKVYCSLIALNPTHVRQSAVQFFSEQLATLDLPVHELRFPQSAKDAYRLNDGVGQQVFILIWSLKPLPLTLSETSLAGHINWTPSFVDGIWRQDDAAIKRVTVGTQEVTTTRRDRGSIETLWNSEPTQMVEVISELLSSFPNDSVHVTAIAFPVHESNVTEGPVLGLETSSQ